MGSASPGEDSDLRTLGTHPRASRVLPLVRLSLSSGAVQHQRHSVWPSLAEPSPTGESTSFMSSRAWWSRRGSSR